jgi:hypothetical protein
MKLFENFDNSLIENISFDNIGKVHDWRNYVLQEIRNEWHNLTIRERWIIYTICLSISDNEEWD